MRSGRWPLRTRVCLNVITKWSKGQIAIWALTSLSDICGNLDWCKGYLDENFFSAIQVFKVELFAGKKQTNFIKNMA